MRSIAILAGLALDRAFGDPTKHHPVAYFGAYSNHLEKRLYQQNTAAGVVHLLTAVTPPLAVTWALHRRYPTLTTAATVWIALGGRTLENTGSRLAHELEKGNVEAARTWVPWLCSRDPQQLDAIGIARAATESIAENTSDAAIAPLVWAAIGGAPAVVLHRCVNTLDAMVGYRNDRYQEFGWAAAKADDALAYLPARITALIHVAQAARRNRTAEAIRAWREDAPKHPSPNAGPVEATAAAALGVQLGGPTTYAHGVERRPRLSRGPKPTTQTVKEAVRLCRRTQLIVGAGMAAIVWLAG